MIKWNKGNPDCAFMTSYVGEVVTTYARLVEVFGQPHFTGGDKVNSEWIIDFNGDIATIYDWKMPETPTDDYNWHIGGHNRKVVALVEALVSV